MTDVKFDGDDIHFEYSMPLVIIGGGACGLVAGLSALHHDIDAIILERDESCRGSTFMSSGFIPAAGTRYQQAFNIKDGPAQMSEDILNKSHQEADSDIVSTLAENSAWVIEWLADEHHIPFELVTGFLYPGHQHERMHCTPRRTGEELMSCLLNAASRAELPILTEARVTTLHVDKQQRVSGISFERRDGCIEQMGCDTLLLACNGYGGNPELLARYIPAMRNALYFGHEGNQGDAIIWGEALNASLKDLAAYQGHGSLAWPHQCLISWAVMMQGGIQLNLKGKRFSNEHSGYSEQAAKVLAQPERIAFDIFDSRIHEQCLQFEDYRNACETGAVKAFDTIDAMAEALEMPLAAVTETFNEMALCMHSGEADQFGRRFPTEHKLQAPYRSVQVTGALFHTQGGLEINNQGQVLANDGTILPNLFAAGGAARGISGSNDSGYLSGNGLLSAVVMGALAGRTVAQKLRGTA